MARAAPPLTGAGVALFTSNLVIASVTVLGLRRHLGVRLRDMVDSRVRFARVAALAKVGIPMAATVLVKFAVLGVLAVAAARVSATAAAGPSGRVVHSFS